MPRTKHSYVGCRYIQSISYFSTKVVANVSSGNVLGKCSKLGEIVLLGGGRYI